MKSALMAIAFIIYLTGCGTVQPTAKTKKFDANNKAEKVLDFLEKKIIRKEYDSKSWNEPRDVNYKSNSYRYKYANEDVFLSSLSYHKGFSAFERAIRKRYKVRDKLYLSDYVPDRRYGKWFVRKAYFLVGDGTHIIEYLSETQSKSKPNKLLGFTQSYTYSYKYHNNVRIFKSFDLKGDGRHMSLDAMRAELNPSFSKKAWKAFRWYFNEGTEGLRKGAEKVRERDEKIRESRNREIMERNKAIEARSRSFAKEHRTKHQYKPATSSSAYNYVAPNSSAYKSNTSSSKSKTKKTNRPKSTNSNYSPKKHYIFCAGTTHIDKMHHTRSFTNIFSFQWNTSRDDAQSVHLTKYTTQFRKHYNYTANDSICNSYNIRPELEKLRQSHMKGCRETPSCTVKEINWRP